jgi:hypothetical protein
LRPSDLGNPHARFPSATIFIAYIPLVHPRPDIRPPAPPLKLNQRRNFSISMTINQPRDAVAKPFHNTPVIRSQVQGANDIKACHQLFRIPAEMHRQLAQRQISSRRNLVGKIRKRPIPGNTPTLAFTDIASSAKKEPHTNQSLATISLNCETTARNCKIVSRCMYPPVGLSFDIILDTISSCTTRESALPIAQCLDKRYKSANVFISDLRAVEVYALIGEQSWTLVQWREVPETDIVAIFKVDQCSQNDEPLQCNYLMHAGTRNVQSSGEFWKRSVLSWCVSSLGSLRELFIGAQHILGLRRWSRYDLLRIYCNPTDQQTHAISKEYVPGTPC